MNNTDRQPMRVGPWKPQPATDEDLMIFAAAAGLAGYNQMMSLRGRDVAKLLDRIAKAEGRL